MECNNLIQPNSVCSFCRELWYPTESIKITGSRYSKVSLTCMYILSRCFHCIVFNFCPLNIYLKYSMYSKMHSMCVDIVL